MSCVAHVARLLTKGLKFGSHCRSFWLRTAHVDREKLTYKAINHIFFLFLLHLRVGLSEIDYTTTIDHCGKNHSNGTALAVNDCTENRKIAGMLAVLCAIFIRYSVNRLWAVWGYTIYKVWVKKKKTCFKRRLKGKAKKSECERVCPGFKQTPYPLKE